MNIRTLENTFDDQWAANMLPFTALEPAFEHDPVTAFAVPNPAERPLAHLDMFAAFIGWSLLDGSVDVTPGLDGCALWLPSEAEPTEEFALAMKQLEERHPLFVDVFNAFDVALPKDPHDHLVFIGVHPRRIGKGVGSALLKHRLATATRPKYLEATTPASTELYKRHDFEVISQIILSNGHVVNQMWREPNPTV